MLHMTVWPSGLRRWLQAPVRKGVGSNPTAVSAVRTARSYSVLDHYAKVPRKEVTTATADPSPDRTSEARFPKMPK